MKSIPALPHARTVLCLAVLVALAGPALTQTAATEAGPRWASLSASQRTALAPLQDDWAGIDADRKEKWLDIAGRFPRMSEDERARVQARMAEWARMSPRERGDVRQRFRETREIAPQGRQALWEQYQALPEDQRRELASRAVPERAASTVASKPVPQRLAPVDEARPKSNLVPNPALSVTPRVVSPSVVKAGPGATTTLITNSAKPPAHQQTGLPKIIATPEFVNRSTLLPQRGLQGAAAAANAPSAPVVDRRP